MESYHRVMREIEAERTNLLSKIDLVQPSFEEQHQLEWGRLYQEEEVSSLKLELDRVSREVEAETTLLRDREEVIREIREEQRQDRIKIQTLLALSQPITPDITVVFESFAPNLALPTLSPREPWRSSSRNRGRSTSPSHPAPAVAVADAPPAGGLGDNGRDAWADDAGDRAKRRGDSAGQQAETVSRYDGEDGGVGGRCRAGGGDRGEPARTPLVNVRNNDRGRRQDATGADAYLERSSDDGKAELKEEGRAAESNGQRQDPDTGPPEVRGGQRGDAVSIRRGRGRSARRTIRGTDGKESATRERRGKQASRLRCTRGYQEHLEGRLELTQRHLEELDSLGREYREILERDRGERDVQVQVQRDNAALVAESLRRRTTVVDERLAQAMEDYLRLRHSAKEAYAVSVEEQKACTEAREKSEAEARRLFALAEVEMEEIKREGRARLDDSTVELRKNLGTVEGVLQGERAHHKEIKRRYEERVERARKGVLSLRQRYRKLVGRRAEEVVYLSDEMSALRRGVTELESRMFAAW